MEEIFIDIRNWRLLGDRFPNKDFLSLEELLGDYEDLIDENEHLQEKIYDMERDIEENYKPISYAEQIGYNPKDFY